MKISVITVSFNARDTIADAISSVRAQDYSNYEHVLVDGASTDGSIGVIENKRHRNLIFVSEFDSGIYEAMNKGVRMATGDLIGFLNADDYFCRTDSLKIIAERAIANSNASAISASVAIVDSTRPSRSLRLYGATNFRRWMLRFGHMPPHPGFYARRSAFEEVGPFRGDYKIASDFEWMVRFFYQNRKMGVFLPEVLVAMRSGGVSTRGFQSTRVINAEVFRALSTHGIKTSRPLIWSKYIAKIGQMPLRSDEFPPPPVVSWTPS